MFNTSHKLVAVDSKDIILKNYSSLMKDFEYYVPGLVIITTNLLGFVIGEIDNKNVVRVIKNNQAYDFIVDKKNCITYNTPIDFKDFSLIIRNNYEKLENKLAKLNQKDYTLQHLTEKETEVIKNKLIEKYAGCEIKDVKSLIYEDSVWYDVEGIYCHSDLFNYCNEHTDFIRYQNQNMKGYYLVKYANEDNTIVVPVVVNDDSFHVIEDFTPIAYKKSKI